jgi:hypothetical protein
MSAFTNPALSAFAATIGTRFVLAQVVIRPTASGFELRHVANEARAAESLELITVEDTASGAFRPLKSAPNLRTGWRVVTRELADLGTALDQLYPGAVSDWFAAQSNPPPATHYRDYVNRQTGMYRIAQLLDDSQAGRMIRANCASEFCLKQRLWTVEGLPADSAETKSALPCLEPCALLLEFARKAMRLEQEPALPLKIAVSEAGVLEAALKLALQQPPTDAREADFASDSNPRRIKLLLEKLAATPRPTPESAAKGD